MSDIHPTEGEPDIHPTEGEPDIHPTEGEPDIHPGEPDIHPGEPDIHPTEGETGESASLDKPYVVYIRSNEGTIVHKIDKADMQYSGLMRIMFLEGEAVVSTEDKPFMFSKICDRNLEILIGYIKKCKIDNIELCAPPKPLPRTTLPDILGSDYDFIRPIMGSNALDHEKLATLSTLVVDAVYLDMVIFKEKLCAAIASILIGKPLETIKSMISAIEVAKI